MRPKIVKYIIIITCSISLAGVLLAAFYFTSGTLSFFNDDDLSTSLTADPDLDFTSDRFAEKTVKRMVGTSDIELHYQKKGFNKEHVDTTIVLKYLTLKNSRHQREVESSGIPVESISSPKAVNTAYYQLESLKSIPIEKLDAGFWQPFLLTRIGISTIVYIGIIALIILITINAFNNTPFTTNIKNKLYLLTALIMFHVLASWILNGMLTEHLQQNYKIFYASHPPYIWFFMGILMLFIATIFNYGIQLQKEQDLTI